MSGVTLREEATAELSTYAYSYPHKSSYCRLAPAVSIAEAWRDEVVSQLSLYVHVPFCEMRCGFCNLFTQSQPGDKFVQDYLAALLRQMHVIRRAVPAAVFQQLAIGGGTPTFLTAGQLELLLGSIESVFGQSICDLPTAVETSPATALPDRLRVLASFGVRRISLGVQSFLDHETKLLGRPQYAANVHRAVESIRSAGPFELNLDLIYGHVDQTRASWQASLHAAMQYRPEELYLYPLYIRPETGLARQGLCAAKRRSDLYREARDTLMEAGYQQMSLRCFRLPRAKESAVYACQRDGMIGLGCGARSYTQRLHYATRFAVTQSGVRAILQEWINLSEQGLSWATHGLWLSDDEQLRRYLILSLLQADGLYRDEFNQRFPRVNVAQLNGVSQLLDRGWLSMTEQRLRLTALGLEYSDEVGPLLYSETVREKLRNFIRFANREAPR